MITLPKRVKAAFLRLKRASSGYIEIKHIKGYFFVYQSTSRWDREKKKPIKVPLYIGRITNAGQLIRAKRKKPRGATPQQGIKMEQPQAESQKNPEIIAAEEKPYKHERQMLRILSMNGRISMPVIGKMVGLRETAVSSQIRKLEKKYSISYIPEIDVTKLGYIQFLITMEFLEEMPNVEELRTILAQEKRVQIAFLTKGDFHLMIYVLARNSIEINSIVINIRKKLHCKSISITAPVEEDYGFIPLRQEFIEMLKDDLLVRDYAVLKEFVNNSKIDFSEIDRKYGFDKGRSQYSYHKLRDKGIIKRVTISLESLPIRYVGLIVSTIIDQVGFAQDREKILSNLIGESSHNLNKYILVNDIVSPSGIVFYLPVFNFGDLESIAEEILKLNPGIRIKTLIITNILVGKFCFRNFDNAYSIQEGILVKEYSEKPKPKLDYEETGRAKRKHTKYDTDIRGLRPDIRLSEY